MKTGFESTKAVRQLGFVPAARIALSGSDLGLAPCKNWGEIGVLFSPKMHAAQKLTT